MSEPELSVEEPSQNDTDAEPEEDQEPSDFEDDEEFDFWEQFWELIVFFCELVFEIKFCSEQKSIRFI